MPESFTQSFKDLTGNHPFPWQVALFKHFINGDFPSACNIPTGLGKTSILAIWLIAYAKSPTRIPRRLVYVVNRRTVVDQTTSEAEKLLEKAKEFGFPTPAISTLRGQFADNREWSRDPSKPAIICGTVDMIGSRLLFSGYGISYRSKPLHAGFLGQDVLLVHDEAHLEPAFQELLKTIANEQERRKEFRSFRIMELTATSRGAGEMFTLTPEDQENTFVLKRIQAKKTITLHPLKESGKLAEHITDLALAHKDSLRPVLVFVRTVEDVMKVRDKLQKEGLDVEVLSGTLRGKERDELVLKPTFKRFLPNAVKEEKTVYLVCTSAGEVGINISADHLVCDLATFESMAQRFGRVNRFGDCNDTQIDIVHPLSFDEENPYETRCKKTLGLMEKLKPNGSPMALNNLSPDQRQEAFAPPPAILPATDILFDAWALTTIKNKLPGRPPVEPYLHGITDWQPPETYVAWREEVGLISGDLLKACKAQDLLDDFPLKPHELLREPSYRAQKHFDNISKRRPDDPVWLIEGDGAVEELTFAQLADKKNKERIYGKTVLLPPSAGGLNDGLLDGKSEIAFDVANSRDRIRIWSDDPAFVDKTQGMHLIRKIDFATTGDDEDAEGKSWCWFELSNEGAKTSKKPVSWEVHVADVVSHTKAIVNALPLDQTLKDTIVFAAKYHDHGKKRRQFQIMLNNRNYPESVLAKSGKKGSRIAETYRHEFGSLIDVQMEKDFQELPKESQQLVLHLIATHHGRARPHFPLEETFDPENDQVTADKISAFVPRQFAILQRKFGRWGLAYLESLLRAADWAASANPSAFVEDSE